MIDASNSGLARFDLKPKRGRTSACTGVAVVAGICNQRQLPPPRDAGRYAAKSKTPTRSTTNRPETTIPIVSDFLETILKALFEILFEIVVRVPGYLFIRWFRPDSNDAPDGCLAFMIGVIFWSLIGMVIWGVVVAL